MKRELKAEIKKDRDSLLHLLKWVLGTNTSAEWKARRSIAIRSLEDREARQ